MADKVLTARASGSGFVRLNKTILDIYSKEILLEAQPLFIFNQFAVQKTELMTNPGLGVNFLQYTDMTGGGRLAESDVIESNAYGESLKQITVFEYGNSVTVSELLLRSSFDDVMGTVKELLGRNYQKVIDTEMRNVVLGATNVAYGMNTVTSTATASRAAITADCTFSAPLVKDVVEHMDTNNTPRFNNDYFISVCSPHQLRSLSDDPYWERAQQYASSVALFTGERGMLEGVRFIQTTQMPSIATGVAGTTSTASWDGAVYQAAFLGANGYGHAHSLGVELRDGGTIDFDRKRALGWYSIEGFDFIIEDSIVVAETA